MTVCIGAVCTDGTKQSLILCADRKTGTWMAGGELGMKFRWAAYQWPALIAGTVARAEELLITYQSHMANVTVSEHNIYDEIKKPALVQKEKLADEYVRTFKSLSACSMTVPGIAGKARNAWANRRCASAKPRPYV